MAIKKEQKKEILEKLEKIAKEAKSLVFVNFHGLTVSDTSKMRKGLKEKGVNYFVAKKTLIKKTLEGAKFEGDIPDLPGEIAVVYGTDDIAPAREVFGFQKTFDDKVKIIGGVFEGIFKDALKMTDIAMIPSIDVLRGRFVNVINSPIQGLVVALNAISEKKS